ncbi:MAG TPA: glycosyltransferase family 39 protein [Candidatus Dormibacteraeota bacterium]|nr:glycosyltransferase family 39 protein [Candidatus Dormibacteraeota bacterium]
MSRAALPAVVRDHPWQSAFVAAFAAVVALKLGGLGMSPPGLYADEASIGYNAWAIAHHGVDEHGNGFPVLYFQAFGEYKNPLYVYLLAPFTWVLPLTAYTVRLPAALCGIAICVLVSATAWTVTRSRAAALAALVTAGLTPWLTLESRVGFEVPMMTLTLVVAIWCYARAWQPGASRLWLAGCSTALGATVFAYSTGRLFAGILAGVLVVDLLLWRRRRLVDVAVPVLLAYLVFGLYAHAHPGALTSRFDALSIGADHPGLVTEALRFLRNYATYDGVPFLFTNGDSNLRHSTGYGGVLLVTTLPLAVLGVVRCLRTWRDPVSRLLIGGLVTAPIPAALTAEGTPHALRSAAMLPFVLVVMALGWAEVLPWLTARRLLAGAVAVAIAADAGGFMWDLFVRYPGRAVTWFDTGEVAAIQTAYALAGGAHSVYISNAVDVDGVAYIQALFALTPAPPARPEDDESRPELAAIGVTVLPTAGDIASEVQPGDLMVLGPGEQAPEGSTLVDTESVTVVPDAVTLPQSSTGVSPDAHFVLARVWRR